MSTPTKVYSQDNYSTTLQTQIVSASGNLEIDVQSPPTFTRGFIFVGPPSNPQMMYFHNRIGSTLYISGPNRLTNRRTQEVGDAVTIMMSTALTNRLEDNMTSTFNCEITDLLTITVFGWPFTKSGMEYTADDVEITVDDNAITYVYLRFSDRTIQSTTSSETYDAISDNESPEYGRLLLTVNAAGGEITSVGQHRPRDFNDYNDINLGGVNTETPNLLNSYIATLLADTPDSGALIAIKNPLDSVDKQMTIEALVAYIEDQGFLTPGFVGYAHTQASPLDTWTVTHNLNSADVSVFVVDSATPAEIMIPHTIDRYANYVTISFAGHAVAGKCIVGAPSGVASTNNIPTQEIVAGEDIPAAKMVRMGISGREAGMNNSYVPDPVTTTFDTTNTSKSLYQSFKALKANLTAIQVYAKKTAAPDTTDLVIDIYATTTQDFSWHTYNVPTGPSLGTATISSGSLAASAAWVTGTLWVAITNLTPGAYYAIKIAASGSQTVLVGYGEDSVDYLTNAFQYTGALAPVVGADFAFKAQAAALVAEVVTKCYLASAFELATSYIIGAPILAVTSGNSARLETNTLTSFTGLTGGIPQFLQDIPGEIWPNAGTNSVPAGLPFSSTSLILR